MLQKVSGSRYILFFYQVFPEVKGIFVPSPPLDLIALLVEKPPHRVTIQPYAKVSAFTNFLGPSLGSTFPWTQAFSSIEQNPPLRV